MRTSGVDLGGMDVMAWGGSASKARDEEEAASPREGGIWDEVDEETVATPLLARLPT